MTFRGFIAVLLLMLPLHSFSQRNDSVRSEYIKSYPDKFFLWPVVKRRALSFKLEDPKGGGRNAEFKPNSAVGLGLGMYLFDLGFELVFAVPVGKKQDSTLGKTKATDLQLNILSKRWGADVFYQRYSGFYLSNPDVPVPPNQPYPQRPDVRTENWGVTGVYVFNPNRFSLRSSFTFADRQLKSSGAFLLSGTFSSFQIHADSAILNPAYVALLGGTNSFVALDYRTISVVPGYAYNFVKNHLFISMFVAIGPAFQEFHYQDLLGVDHSNTKVNSYLDARVAIGYSNDRFFAGITTTNQIRNVVFENVRFGSSSTTFRLLFGWRFTEVGFLKKSVWDHLPPWGKKKE